MRTDADPESARALAQKLSDAGVEYELFMYTGKPLFRHKCNRNTAAGRHLFTIVSSARHTQSDARLNKTETYMSCLARRRGARVYERRG
jgi:hypothetical protein